MAFSKAHANPGKEVGHWTCASHICCLRKQYDVGPSNGSGSWAEVWMRASRPAQELGAWYGFRLLSSSRVTVSSSGALLKGVHDITGSSSRLRRGRSEDLFAGGPERNGGRKPA